MSTLLIGDIVKQFLEKYGKNELFLEKRAVESWEKVVGPLIAKYTKKVNSKNGILTIKVLNGALRFELMGMKSEIIRKLNQEVGQDVIKDIILK
ncbi:MAG TPA: DUF721 domain-containing protein [Bacteroidales bacterium]|nr:DUF721 domain-containing protein [Bacteroidales bacterium]